MEWMQFPNGCVHLCVRYDLYSALEYLEEHDYPFESIILDTEGLVIMTPFAAAFWEDEELGSRVFHDSFSLFRPYIHYRTIFRWDHQRVRCGNTCTTKTPLS